MLRRQSSNITPMSFLAGNSEMARRIRAHDWSGHPFGLPETWPQALKSALGICLNSAFPTAIYWGSDLRLLYNDAWSLIPGPRHPACLGEPAREVWSDIWHIIEPQFTEVIETGEGLFLDDQLLPMRRYGFEEETFWSYNFTPIRGAEGAIEGIFNSGQETTAKVFKQRETAFLLELMDSLRACEDARAIMDLSCRMLAGHLGAIRVGLREAAPEAAPEADAFPVRAEWTAEGVAPVGGSPAWQRLGALAARLKEGHVVRIGHPGELDAAEAQALEELGAASVIAVPWHRAGQLVAVLFVHRAEARPWEDEIVATVENVLARVMRAIDEERTYEREKTLAHEIDHRARNMLGVSQALIRMVRADDVESFRQSLMERMGSLGNTLGVLSRSQWAGADLEEILRSELAPYVTEGSGKARLSGPGVMIAARNAQPVAMALHELVTNAVKYGALSLPEGRLHVAWQVGPDGVLGIDWTESQVQQKPKPAGSGSGFGSRLIETMIERQLGGTVTRDFSDGGLACRIEIPLPEQT